MVTLHSQLLLNILNSTAVSDVENARENLWQNIHEACCVFDL